MREVRIKYSPDDLEETDLYQTQFPIVKDITLIGTLRCDFDNMVIDTLVELVMQEGYQVEDINQIPWLNLLEYIGVENKGGQEVHQLVVQNIHYLVTLGLELQVAVIVPGSYVGEKGIELIIRGTNPGCKKFIEMYSQWVPNPTVSISQDSELIGDAPKQLLSETHQEFFRCAWQMGYYEQPRKCTIEEVGKALGYARLTSSKYLREIESHLAEELWDKMANSLISS